MFTLKSGINSLLLLTLMALMLSGCYYDVAEELYPASGPCDTTVYTYNGFVQPLIASQCLSCHPGFNTYDVIKSKASDINSRINRDVNATGFMPKGRSKLNPCDLKKFDLWMKANFPL